MNLPLAEDMRRRAIEGVDNQPKPKSCKQKRDVRQDAIDKMVAKNILNEIESDIIYATTRCRTCFTYDSSYGTRGVLTDADRRDNKCPDMKRIARMVDRKIKQFGYRFFVLDILSDEYPHSTEPHYRCFW